MSKMTLNTLFNFQEKGIFGYLESYNVPWKTSVPSNLLDLDYHTKHGDKIASKTVISLVDVDGLSDANKQKLANLIYLKNSVKWDKLWSTLALYDEFNPLYNKDVEDTTTITHSGTDTKDSTIGGSTQTFAKGEQTNSTSIGTQTLEEGKQTNQVGSQNNTVENKTSAFNSSTYQPDNSSNQNIGSRSDVVGAKTTTTGSRSDSETDGSRTDTTTNSSQSNSDVLTNEYTETITVTSRGNQGITTSGELIEDFRKIVDWTIFETVFDDLNEILVLDMFGDVDATLDDYTIETNYVLPVASNNKLGGIKVGTNLSITNEGVLNAVAAEAPVQSVNGKTGVVVLNSTDLDTYTRQTINNKLAEKQDKISTEGVENGSFYGVWNGQASFRECFQVPAYDGTVGQVLTKADGVRYEWTDPQGSSSYIKLEPSTKLLHRHVSMGTYANNFIISEYNTTNNTETVVFNVEEYRGKEFEIFSYFDTYSSSNYINRFRGGFIDDTINLEQTSEIIVERSHGRYFGCSGEPSINGIFSGLKVPAITFNNDDRYVTDYYKDFGNFGGGIIPSFAKYFIIYTSNVITDSNRNNIHYDMTIKI